ncbi:MAG TPA: nucleoside triphosphate pyrophosphohydrolase [Firmicutes bacterium]|nr:nucleoside triphosphate pyrophosphohydrolase [Bacillota bacterium]
MASVVVVGLGPGGADWLPASNIEELKKADRVFVRTERHPSVDCLTSAGVRYTSFDHVYETAADYQEVYSRIVEAVLAASADSGVVAYAVPGSPLIGEASVFLLKKRCAERGVPIRIVPAPSFVDALVDELEIDVTDGLAIFDAASVARSGTDISLSRHNFFMQVYNRGIGSDLKLWLMNILPEEHPVNVVRAAGVPRLKRFEQVPVWKLDRLEWIDHLTSVHVEVNPGDELKSMRSLVSTVATLRGEGGCPWDRAQTHESLRPYVIEEGYEVIAAIDSGDANKLREELGDLLLQVVLHAQISAEEGAFNIYDVIGELNRKMIRRHPHVFGRAHAKTAEEVLLRWDALKKAEAVSEGEKMSVLGKLPSYLPALMQALKIQQAASRMGFDWENVDGPFQKIFEEANELKAAAAQGGQNVEAEAGDLLFSVVNYCRFLNVDPELALKSAVKRFVRRFELMDELARKRGSDLSSMSLEQLDALWEESKKDLRS